MGNLTLPVTRSYTTAIPFDQPEIDLGEHTVTGPITFTKVTTGVQATFCTAVTLIADGTNVPDFSAFDGNTGAAASYDNTVGAVNQVFFYYLGGRYCVTVKPLSGTGGGGGDVTAPLRTSIVVEDATPTKVRITYNETLDGASVPANSDYILNEASAGSGFTGTPVVGSNYVELTLSTPMAFGDVWDLGYTGTAVKDVAGNSAAGFTTINITNNVAGGGSGYEAETDAYLTASSNTGLSTPVKDAIDDLCVVAKGIGTSKIRGMYIITGGTAAKHKWNFFNLFDTDAAKRLSFLSTYSHTSAGMDPAVGGAGEGYADTFINPFDEFDDTTGISVFVMGGNDIDKDQLMVDIGAYTAGPDNSCNVSLGFLNNYKSQLGGGDLTFASTTTDAFVGGTISPAGVHKLWVNGIEKATETLGSQTYPNLSLYISGRHVAGSVNLRTTRICQFVLIAEYITDAQVASLNTAVQALQTALSR